MIKKYDWIIVGMIIIVIIACIFQFKKSKLKSEPKPIRFWDFEMNSCVEGFNGELFLNDTLDFEACNGDDFR